MFPFRDHNPSNRTPFVTYGLIAINVVIYFLTMGIDPTTLYANYALVPAWVSDGQELSGVFSSMFLHGGFMHLFGNMLFLWVFGDNIEDAFGHVLFLVFYLLCGVAAGVFHVVLAPNSMVPLIGASGAIAGVLGGYWLLFPRARVDTLVFYFVVAIPAFWVLLAWFAIQIFSGFSSATGGGGVAYWAHFAGFVAGVVLTLPYWLKRGGRRWVVEHRGKPDHPSTPINKVGTLPKISRRP